MKFLLLFIILSFNLFSQSSFFLKKLQSRIFSLSLGKSLVQNDLNDSRNTAYQESIYYLMGNDSRFIKDIYSDKLYENSEKIQKENSSIKYSRTNFNYGFDIFINRKYTFGLGRNTQNILIQNNTGENYPGGGYDLLLFYLTHEKGRYLGGTYPLASINRIRNLTNYYFSFGRIFRFTEDFFHAKFLLGSGNMSFGRLGYNKIQLYSVGAKLSYSYLIKSKEEVSNKSYSYAFVELSVYRYFVPGDYLSKYAQRLETNGFLNINEVNLSFGIKIMNLEDESL
jgi:hypothetical protein